MKKIFSNKLFMATFVSDLISNFGDIVYYLALMNYVLILPNGKTAIALVTISETFPFLTNIVMGILGDRTKNKVDTILGTLFFRVLLYGIIGLVMGFKPTLWILVIAVIINVLSDLAGQYENALFKPVTLRIIKEEDREKFLGFRQGTMTGFQMGFMASGAILLMIFNFQQLAFVNALTFLMSSIIILSIRKGLKKKVVDAPIHINESEKSDPFIKEIKKSLYTAYESLSKVPVLKSSIIIVAGLNAILAVEDAILLLIFKENPNFGFGSLAATIAILGLVSSIGMILGSFLLTRDQFTITIEQSLLGSTLAVVTLFLGIFLQNVYTMMFAIGLLSISIGIINPKVEVLIMKTMPENQLATITSGISTFCTFSMVISKALVSALVLFLSAKMLGLLFLLLSLILLGYTIKKYYF
ncbi:MFS transporter [Streptococcus parauberis]|uniref:MFS transporter n=1 Tax=Streptococcus parauberis TaxID=1348 RepID=UPI00020CBCAD|nr:MFS transporter [Streptococcus parauberis]AEF25953.1 Major Facilitator Superfamily protein [Streptococcus parauberis KCTC 11537]EMF48977.1 lantibiotic efflux protein [Streptococcus parauberis KRS-02109]KYP19866.1 Major Facilitator Superfamily protein [Streptococcus parauberis]KYP19961.1 Major Facilitator Superfamily protein [Streptococcus parauberis]KYP22720.1 Major Facilitator Superfamily protein [Streptococcus parauberis]